MIAGRVKASLQYLTSMKVKDECEEKDSSISSLRHEIAKLTRAVQREKDLRIKVEGEKEQMEEAYKLLEERIKRIENHQNAEISVQLLTSKNTIRTISLGLT